MTHQAVADVPAQNVARDPICGMIVEKALAGRTWCFCSPGCKSTSEDPEREQLPFPDASFDVAVASLVLHHLPPDLKLKALGEIRRTLRPGGRLLVAELHRPRGLPARLLSAPLRGLSWLRPHLSGGTPRLLEAAGFRSVRELARWGGGVAVWEALKS